MSVLLILFIIVVLVGYTCRGACADSTETKQAIEKQGYSNVKITDKSIFFVGWRGCSSNDAIQYDVTAKNPKDQTVDLIVCSGWPFKGVTIRTK